MKDKIILYFNSLNIWKRGLLIKSLRYSLELNIIDIYFDRLTSKRDIAPEPISNTKPIVRIIKNNNANTKPK